MSDGLTILKFQELMKNLYLKRDKSRGPEKTMLWLVSELGELAECIKENTPDFLAIEEEMADILAWLCSLANIYGIDLGSAAWKKYPGVCSSCRQNPCKCDPR
ncbi:MAG: MazG nucleotide pyrophosphohydrolase domain-containing protein [Candidatus Hodarchaeales archaeon]